VKEEREREKNREREKQTDRETDRVMGEGRKLKEGGIMS
jgi:hypothetical protein